jgi:hypothetical protein
VLYGTASGGGLRAAAVIFRAGTNGGGFTILNTFSGIDPNTEAIRPVFLTSHDFPSHRPAFFRQHFLCELITGAVGVFADAFEFFFNTQPRRTAKEIHQMKNFTILRPAQQTLSSQARARSGK